MAHSGILTLAILERIVTEKTKIIPLHQGFWYFRLASGDIVKARQELKRFKGKKVRKLPFVDLSKKFIEITEDKVYREISTGYYSYLANILKSIRKRWSIYKELAQIVAVLPTNGETENLPLGSIVDFSVSTKWEPRKPVSKASLQTAFQALIAEYQSMKGETDRSWEWQDHMFNYLLLIIGSVITLVSVFPNLELLLIFASFILSLTGWALIEKSIHMTNIGRFFTKELVPRANALLREIEEIEPHDPSTEKLRVLIWEVTFRGRSIHIALQGLASMGRFLMATVPGFASAMTFLYLKQSSGVPWSNLELILFPIAAGMGLLPLVTMMINIRYAYSGEE